MQKLKPEELVEFSCIPSKQIPDIPTFYRNGKPCVTEASCFNNNDFYHAGYVENYRYLIKNYSCIRKWPVTTKDIHATALYANEFYIYLATYDGKKGKLCIFAQNEIDEFVFSKGYTNLPKIYDIRVVYNHILLIGKTELYKLSLQGNYITKVCDYTRISTVSSEWMKYDFNAYYPYTITGIFEVDNTYILVSLNQITAHNGFILLDRSLNIVKTCYTGRYGVVEHVDNTYVWFKGEAEYYRYPIYSFNKLDTIYVEGLSDLVSRAQKNEKLFFYDEQSHVVSRTYQPDLPFYNPNEVPF